DLDEMAGLGAGALERRPDAAGQRDVVVLDQHGIVETKAVIGATAQAYRLLFEDAPPGGCLAGADDLGLVPLARIDQRARRRRDAREPADQVQRSPLGRQHRPRAAADACHRLALLEPAPVGAEAFEAEARVEQLEGEEPGL